MSKLKEQKSSAELLDTDRVPNLTLKQYQPLIDLLLDPKQVLVGILCDTTDLCDGDKIAKNLFNIFEFQGSTTLLLRESIAHEIEKCTQSTLLFRNNSICSKMLTVWARLLGLDYLRQSIGGCIEDIANSSESFEVDPNRAKADTDLQANMARLEAYVQRFFQNLCDSAAYCPKQIKLICHFLQSLTTGKFPDAGYFVVAGFFFLRYVCPAIVTPPSYGLLSTFPKKESHRGLVLVAKVLQNLANGVDFKKEPFMQPLNSFLVENQGKFQEFITQLSSSAEPSGVDLPSLNQTPATQLSSMTEMHQFLMKNITRITEILSASSETSPAEIQMANKVKDLLTELEKLEKGDSTPSKEKKASASESTLFGEVAPREIVLNVERVWGEAVRLPVIASIDLLSRAQQICEDNPTPVAYPSKGMSHSIDWQAMSDSIDFSEFVLDTSELQKVDLSKLTNQKEALAFWLNVANTMVIHMHVVNGAPNSKSRRKMMLQSLKYEIGFQKFSLEDIIEGVLRGNPKGHFKKKDPRIDFCMQHYDPRFHFGMSFLTASSPSIRVFNPETVSQQLNYAAELFLDEEVTFVEEKKKIILPQLLDKYYQDFGVFHSDIFRWLAKYLDQSKRLEIGKIVATTHYTFEYNEFSWEPKRSLLFARDPPHPRISTAEQFALDFPTELILQKCKENSEPVSSGDDLGILNLEINWVAPARRPVDLSMDLARFAQGLCDLFLFDWGSIAGSPEFKSFLLATAELQKVELGGLSFHETMAFWINIYSTLLIHLYIMKRPPGEMSMFWRKNFFTTYKYQIGKASYSLVDIEEGVIRGNIYKHFKLKDERYKFILSTDPRSAFLFSLLTKSSPPVRIYDDTDMEAALTKSTQLYLRKGIRFDQDKKKIYLPSRAKELYENDFKKKKEELLMWVAQFLSPEQKAQLDALFASKKKISVSFDEFDWTPWPVFEKL